VTEFVLVGQWGDSVKAVGPFASADDARESCNDLGMTEVAWNVVPLLAPLADAADA
jgi:hypothetical protein